MTQIMDKPIMKFMILNQKEAIQTRASSQILKENFIHNSYLNSYFKTCFAARCPER